jgi:hypothetical protein
MLHLADIRPGMPLNVLHPEYALLTEQERRERARAKLDEYIEAGRNRSRRVVEAIMGERPADRHVPAQTMRFAALGDGLRVVLGSKTYAVHQHALDQAAERLGLNLKYTHGLQNRHEAWSNQLIATNLNELLAHEDSKTRYLVREVQGKVRAVLSDAYRRIDSGPVLDSLIGAAEAASAIIVDGTYTETRVSLKVIRDRPIEVFPGEWMVFGLDFSNSDYGDGPNEFSSFLLRLACLNGAIACTELRKVHIGRRYSGDDEASQRTLRLDAAAQASAARDQVNALLSPGATEKVVGYIRKANGTAIGPDQIAGFLRTRTSKAETGLITDKFASADVVELPAGQTSWRLSNAISWLAKNTDDNRRRLDLERIAGEALG